MALRGRDRIRTGVRGFADRSLTTRAHDQDTGHCVGAARFELAQRERTGFTGRPTSPSVARSPRPGGRCPRKVSNLRPPGCGPGALPLSYAGVRERGGIRPPRRNGRACGTRTRFTSVKGWGPTHDRTRVACPGLVSNQRPSACRADALPLSYRGVAVREGVEPPRPCGPVRFRGGARRRSGGLTASRAGHARRFPGPCATSRCVPPARFERATPGFVIQCSVR